MNKQITEEYAAAAIECRGKLQTNLGNRERGIPTAVCSVVDP